MNTKTRIVLPAFPVLKNVDGAAVETMFFQARQLWQDLACLDESLMSDKRRHYNEAVALASSIRFTKSRILDLRKGQCASGRTEENSELAERTKCLVDMQAQIREVHRRLGAHPSTLHDEMVIERRVRQEELMKASPLWLGHQEQVLFRYEKARAEMHRRGKQGMPTDKRAHSSMLLFPSGMTSIADVLVGKVPYLWIQQPNEFEIRSSSRNWRTPMEKPMLAEFRLGGDRYDWSYPVARLIIDTEPLTNGNIDPDMEVSLVSLRRVSEWNLYVDVVLLNLPGEKVVARTDIRAVEDEQAENLDSELAALGDTAHLPCAGLSPYDLPSKFGRVKAGQIGLMQPHEFIAEFAERMGAEHKKVAGDFKNC